MNEHKFLEGRYGGKLWKLHTKHYLCACTSISSVIQSRWIEWAEHGMHEKCIKMLDRKDIWQEPFGKRGCEWEDIKVDVLCSQKQEISVTS